MENSDIDQLKILIAYEESGSKRIADLPLSYSGLRESILSEWTQRKARFFEYYSKEDKRWYKLTQEPWGDKIYKNSHFLAGISDKDNLISSVEDHCNDINRFNLKLSESGNFICKPIAIIIVDSENYYIVHFPQGYFYRKSFISWWEDELIFIKNGGLLFIPDRIDGILNKKTGELLIREYSKGLDKIFTTPKLSVELTKMELNSLVSNISDDQIFSLEKRQEKDSNDFFSALLKSHKDKIKNIGNNRSILEIFLKKPATQRITDFQQYLKAKYYQDQDTCFVIEIDENNKIILPQSQEELDVILTFLESGYTPQLIAETEMNRAMIFLEPYR